MSAKRGSAFAAWRQQRIDLYRQIAFIFAMTDLSKPLPFGLSRRNWPILAAVVVVIIALAAPADRLLSAFAQGWPQPFAGLFARVTNLGLSDWILIPALVLLLISGGLALLLRRGPPLPRLALLQMTSIWAFVFVGVGLPGLLTAIAKRLIGRSRPVVFDSDGAYAFHLLSLDWRFESFPSGHTTTSFAFAMVVAFLRPNWFWPAIVIAALVGVSRLAVGMHYGTDVIGGAVLGVLGAYLVRLFFASRGWGFQRLPDGRIEMRPLSAVHRLMRRRDTGAAPRPYRP
jgi:undecaprenyl-diphosphatase